MTAIVFFFWVEKLQIPQAGFTQSSAFLSLPDKQLHINTRPVLSDGTSRKPAAGEAEDTGASPQPPQSGIPRHTPHEEERAGSNILVYVSVLAAVVLGLLLYVAYKW